MKTIFAVLFFLCMVSQAFAGGASSGWNSPWDFPTPQNKANGLNQAMAMKFIESGGYNVTNNQNYFQQQHCNTDGACFNGTAVAIGTNINVDGNGNLVTGTNDGNVGAQNNNGEGEINQDGGQDAE